MTDPFDLDARRAIKTALARQAYEHHIVRIAEPDLRACSWLVATHRGVFGVSQGRVFTVLHGWYFGICRHDKHIYLFENCGLRDRSADLGRIVRIELADGRLADAAVLVTGLHTNCHQIRVIDGLLCVVDTANQAIRRYTLGGERVDVREPFPVAPPTDRTGAYLHINGIARLGSHVALMLHNGKALPEKSSELALLDEQWNPLERHSLAGRWCHDIVEDEDGVIWHCGSEAGELLNSKGLKFPVSQTLLTRGLAVTRERIVVGVSTFGPRQQRDSLAGGLVVFDRALNRIAQLTLDGPPTDVLALQDR